MHPESTIQPSPRTQPGPSDAANAAPASDFKFTNADFEWLRTVANRHSGIMLPDTKRTMVYSRLAKRLRFLGLKKFSEYRALLESGKGNEFGEFINALTTNLTSFFREPHHFEHLEQVAIPELLASNRADRTVHIWSAGCSTGEEPYTISMVAQAALADLRGKWNYRILATDLDTKVLATAAAGVYTAERIANLDPSTMRRYFQRGAGSLEGQVRVRGELQRSISFEQFNLVKDWSRTERFDVIFCRNVVIYFDKPTQRLLFDKFADSMNPGGYLYVGHSESLFQVTQRFQLVGKTAYQRVG